MIIRPSPKKRRGRYEEVEFDVPGVVRTKRCRMDIRLDFVTKEVADAYGPTLREAKRITDTRYTSTLYPLNPANCEKYLTIKSKVQDSIRKWCAQRWPVPLCREPPPTLLYSCTHMNPAPSCLVFWLLPVYVCACGDSDMTWGVHTWGIWLSLKSNV
jgi:hypothetical protein